MIAAVIAGVAGVVILIAFVTDISKQKIPNWLTLGTFIMGMLFHSLVGGLELQGWFYSLLGAAAGFVPLLILYALRGIGAGDVKLFGALGAWLGAAATTQLLLYSILYAGAFGLLLLCINRLFARKMKSMLLSFVYRVDGSIKNQWFSWASSGKSFPFMLAVLPAAITIWLM